MNLLITSAESRKCFDIFNILNPKLTKIYLCSDLGVFARGLLSLVYFKKVFKTEKIFKLIQSRALHTKILPVEEADLELIYGYELEYSSLLPDKNAFYGVANKKLLFQHAIEHSVPCPRTIGADEITSNYISGSVVVKPFRGTGSEGVRFFDDYTKATLYIKSLPNPSDMLVQELIGSNRVVAGCFLFDKGHLTSFYGHERLRTYPTTGGVTVCSVSHNDPRIMDLGQQLLAPLKWSGLAMVEFMWSDLLKDYQLIEINPRAWGSIRLSEKCGSNMLMNYVDLIHGKSVTKSIGRENCYIRWLMPYDIINLAKGVTTLSEYRNMNKKNDCLINISYSNFIQSGIFHIFQITRVSKIIKKFFS